MIDLKKNGFDTIQIETKGSCNMACSFCPYPLKTDTGNILEIETIVALLNQIGKNNRDIKYVTLSQFNEPLLDNRIFEIIKLVKSYGLKVHLITNGLLLNKEKNIQGFIDSEPDHLKISLQVLDSDLHKDARGIDMDFKRYSETLINFLPRMKKSNTKILIDLGCNFNDKKISYFFHKLLGQQSGDPSVANDKKTVIKKFENFLELFGQYFTSSEKKIAIDEIRKSRKDYFGEEGIKLSDNISIKLKSFWYGRKIEEFYPISNNFSCETSILGILADGTVVPCCLAYDKRLSFGNIKNEKLNNILANNLDFMNNLRKIGGEKDETCKKCMGCPSKKGVFFKNKYLLFKKILQRPSL